MSKAHLSKTHFDKSKLPGADKNRSFVNQSMITIAVRVLRMTGFIVARHNASLESKTSILGVFE